MHIDFEGNVKNFMEDAVLNIMDSILRDINVCTCKNCTYDIFAIALNDLPPRYVSTRKGELYSKINNLAKQYDIDIISAITKAAVLVSRNPRHW